jgi:HEPN domain-containing protein
VASSTPREVRRFYLAAVHRFDEARFLLQNSYTTAAVYLAGYTVECALKSLILAGEPSSRHAATLATFHTKSAHDYEWLREKLGRRKVALPAGISRHLAKVTWWATDLRYSPGAIKRRDAVAFLDATEQILGWAKGRL